MRPALFAALLFFVLEMGASMLLYFPLCVRDDPDNGSKMI